MNTLLFNRLRLDGDIPRMDDEGLMAIDIHVKPSGAALAADIEGVDLSRPLSAAALAVITDAWREHLVLRLRAQDLSDEDLLAFSRRFGPLDKAPINPYGAIWVPENPEMNVISNVRVDGQRIGGLGDGEAFWHADMTYTDDPPRACMLFALEVPDAGGDTGFASMIAAYAALPRAMQRRLDGLQCKHDASRNSTGQLRKDFDETYADVRAVPGAVHPLVRVHPDTGAKALYPGRRNNAYVMGLAIDESEALLDEIWGHVAKPEFNWHQQWRVGDLIMWDNRFVLHRRDAFDPNARRHMRRTQIGDVQPVLGPGDRIDAA